jgi:hypothetical protein
MTDELSQRAERLSRELDAAFRNRADLYRLFYTELEAEFGAVKAEAIMVRAVERRGREVAEAAFAGFGPNDARAIGEAFLSVSPDDGRMYPTDVRRSAARSRMPGWKSALATKSSPRFAALPAPSTAGCSRRPACNLPTSPGPQATVTDAATSVSPTEKRKTGIETPATTRCRTRIRASPQPGAMLTGDDGTEESP